MSPFRLPIATATRPCLSTCQFDTLLVSFLCHPLFEFLSCLDGWSMVLLTRHTRAWWFIAIHFNHSGSEDSFDRFSFLQLGNSTVVCVWRPDEDRYAVEFRRKLSPLICSLLCRMCFVTQFICLLRFNISMAHTHTIHRCILMRHRRKDNQQNNRKVCLKPSSKWL